MKFLLKIVQGPNAGAEIALVEGVRVTLGSADACDIVLADPTLPAEACAIEASSDAVVLTPSGAEPERLDPLRVRSFGTTALAVGPADAPWGPLVWEAPAGGDAAAGTDEARSPSAPPAQAEAPLREGGGGEAAGGSTPSGAAPAPSRPRRARRLGCLVLLLLLLIAAAWLLLPRLRAVAHPDEQAPSCSTPVDAPPLQLPDLLSRYNLDSVETNGTTFVRGDFSTRAERLAATAALYEAQPGIALDLVDRETLLASTADLLAAATDGALEVTDVTNRVAVLAGRVPDPSFLAAALDAIRTDVPRLSGVDTAAVTLISPISRESPSNSSPVTRRPSPAVSAPAAPKLPLCGVLLQPYPCLVLQNGQRLAIGAEVGGYKIETIARDRITLRRGEEKPVEWTP